MIDKKTQDELRTKYNPDGSILRKGQLRMLEMLKFVDRVCTENNITYWLDSGTLLGATRHGGYIPWDDDTDICMPHKDAERFKEIMLNNNLSNEFVLQCRETDQGYFGCWYMLRDLKSEYIQDSLSHKRRELRGLQVDIFIVEEKTWTPLYWTAQKINTCLVDKPIQFIKNYSLAKLIAIPSFYLFHKVIKPLFRFISPKRNFVRLTYGSFFRKRFVKNIYPLQKILFEGFEFNCPANYDGYLENIYGNWKELPKKIQTHEVEMVFNFSC